MSIPVWITPAGSLGSIPEGIFYQNTMLVTTDPLPISPTCTATTTGTNTITCSSTTGIYAGLTVMFSGATFGGVDPAIRYYVLDVVNATQFRITTTDTSTTPVLLTTATGTMDTVFRKDIYYTIIAGQLPPGVQCSANGTIIGVPQALASLQGVPFDVGRDVTSKFTLRAYTENQDETIDRIRDRTFSLTVINTNVPVFTSPSDLGLYNAGTFTVGRVYRITFLGSTIWTDIGWEPPAPGQLPAVGDVFTATGVGVGTGQAVTAYYDGDKLDIQLDLSNVGPNAPAVVSLISGALPGGIRLSPEGLIYGYIQPYPDVDNPPGYELTSQDTQPYDFVVSAISKNYQFTLQVTDGVTTDIKTFNFFVYNRTTLNASTTLITADNSIVTADEGQERRPFIINALPSDLGTVRGDNYQAYQFIGNDYDTSELKYAISVNIGSGLPPGLELDPNSGWYYGYIPDQGVTSVEYSFNIVTYQSVYVGTAISCTATTFGTDLITCNSTSQIETGQPIVFVGTSFGGIVASATQVYYVLSVESATEFTITNNLGSSTAVTLSTSSGSLNAYLIVASDPYPFTLTVSGAINAEVVWNTPTDLGYIENGSTSMLAIEAENVGGRTLKYRLKPGPGPEQLPYPYVPGVYNSLPQGLKLLDTGEISGRVSFNTFAVDLGDTTFDASQSVVRNTTIQETTFDSTYVFTVNAYAEDTGQVLYKVNSVTVNNGGTGYSGVNLPVLAFNTPIGASAIQATTGNITVSGGVITSVEVNNTGSGYTSPATLVVTEGFGGSNAVFTPVMKATGIRDVVSVDKTFTVRVLREYNKPYQNLLIEAMPPANDRAVIASLLDNTEIFVPDYIYRIDDPYFGKSERVIYQHAFGLAPDTLDTYVSSLYENHYWKNLVLGQVETAQAIDPITGEVVYEVVYSKIVDDLVNTNGVSVSKIVNLPYAIIDPLDGSTQLTQVYPNSLVNMRDQVIDVVGQISTKLPLWMTSKQTNGRVLGFTPAWVMCYTKPDRSRQIAYYISTQFQGQLNAVDFKVDRYVLDRTLSRNWNTETQRWTPTPSLTTFDRYGSGNLPFIGYVDIATQLAYMDINNRTVEQIAELGGLDGPLTAIDGNTLIFAKQEYYTNYPSADAAWQNYTTLYGGIYSPETTGESFDESYTIPSGYTYECTNTDASTDYIKAETTVGMMVDDPAWFASDVFGGIISVSNNLTKIYYVTEVVNTECTATAGGTNLITCDDATYLNTNDIVWFSGTTFGGIDALDASNNIQQYYVTKISSTSFKVSLTEDGPFVALSTASGSMIVNTTYFAVSLTQGGDNVTLTTASGSMLVNFGDYRMSIYTINVDPLTDVVTLEPTTLTAETQYVQIVRGRNYAGQQLYYPTSPAQGYTLVSWINVPESNTTETTFDATSMAFEVPVDMYDPTDRDDKYLVFPKANILV